MSKSIQPYSTTYVISDELKSFFITVSTDKSLQEKLYFTAKLSEVAAIAQGLGFTISAAELIKAQAGRVLAILDENSDDVQNLVSGIKPKTGAQWGRGQGFLDRAGYWLNTLSTPVATVDNGSQMDHFLNKINSDIALQKNLEGSKTFNEVALLAETHGFGLKATEFLSYQAKKVLMMNEAQAEALANN